MIDSLSPGGVSKMMRLIAAVLIFGFIGASLQAEPPAKPGKPVPLVKPVSAKTEKPAPPIQSLTVEAPAETVYEEPKPMKEADPKVRFGKIYDFINDPELTPVGDNRAMAYEFKYFNYGAITKEEKKNKKGHYFVINWKNEGEAENLILRFDYRQEQSREKLNTLEIPVSAAQGNLRGMFSVRGDAYEKFGKVNSWRISVIRQGQIVAEKKSFIW